MIEMNKARVITLVRIFRVAPVFLLVLLAAGNAAGQDKVVRLGPIDRDRVEEIAGLLSDAPRGFAEPVTDRTYWDKLLKSGYYDSFLEEMKDFVFPAF